VIIPKMVLQGTLAAALCTMAAPAAQATLVPRTVFAEEFGWIS